IQSHLSKRSLQRFLSTSTTTTITLPATSTILTKHRSSSSNNPNTTPRSKHTLAITRHIPDSFRDALSAHHDASSSPISLTQCRTQHARYQTVLQSLLPRPIVSLPPLEHHPDCPFVEDVVVVANGVACITNPGHPSRRGDEVDSVKNVLLDLPSNEGCSSSSSFCFVEGESLFDMRNSNNNNYNNHDNDDDNDHVDNDDDDNDHVDDRGAMMMATADGGDVLYTGRHLFVGLSDRTNYMGYEFLRSVFGPRLGGGGDAVVVPVVIPPVERGTTTTTTTSSVLHLKSAVTHLDDRTLLAPEGPLGDAILEAMKAEERGYRAIRLGDVLSCNVVVVNDHVLVQDSDCDVSTERIVEACRERGLGWTFVDTGELAKKDAALTCCSVLLECG
ncbi:hypothetical protein ACHAXS_009945, partial [Conticribra weissflogii]